MNRRKFLTVSALAPWLRAPAAAPARGITLVWGGSVDIFNASSMLSPFCLRGGDPEYRASLRRVFSINGWRVATDGRVCVRAFDPKARRADESAPRAENLLWDGPWGYRFYITGFPPEPDYVRCGECGKQGPYVMGEEHGWCGSCEGEGVANTRTGGLPEKFGGLQLRLKYVEKILALPGVVWRLPKDFHNDAVNGWRAPAGLVHFEWSGGDGLLVPLAHREDRLPDVRLRADWT